MHQLHLSSQIRIIYVFGDPRDLFPRVTAVETDLWRKTTYCHCVEWYKKKSGSWDQRRETRRRRLSRNMLFSSTHLVTLTKSNMLSFLPKYLNTICLRNSPPVEHHAGLIYRRTETGHKQLPSAALPHCGANINTSFWMSQVSYSAAAAV
jgi:hypothetical protein